MKRAANQDRRSTADFAHEIAVATYRGNPVSQRYNHIAWYHVTERLINRGFRLDTVRDIMSSKLPGIIADLNEYPSMSGVVFFEYFDRFIPKEMNPNGPLV